MRAEVAQLDAPVVFERERLAIPYVRIDGRKSSGHDLEDVWAPPEGWTIVGWPSGADK